LLEPAVAALDNPGFGQPEYVAANRILGVVLTSLRVGQILQRLDGIVVARRVP
jgi:hypothetical protein